MSTVNLCQGPGSTVCWTRRLFIKPHLQLGLLSRCDWKGWAPSMSHLTLSAGGGGSGGSSSMCLVLSCEVPSKKCWAMDRLSPSGPTQASCSSACPYCAPGKSELGQLYRAVSFETRCSVALAPILFLSPPFSSSLGSCPCPFLSLPPHWPLGQSFSTWPHY